MQGTYYRHWVYKEQDMIPESQELLDRSFQWALVNLKL